MASVFNLNSIFLSVNHYRMKEVMLFRQLDFFGGRGHQIKNKLQRGKARQSVAIATLKLVELVVEMSGYPHK